MCTDIQLSQLVQLTNGADSQVAQVVVNYVRENITEVEVGQSRQVFVDLMAAHISDLVSACITHCTCKFPAAAPNHTCLYNWIFYSEKLCDSVLHKD